MRIATYTITDGTFEELLGIATAPGGICEIYGGVPGFVRFEIINLGNDEFSSVTVWESMDAVDQAMATAGDHIQQVLGGRAEQTFHKVGHVAHTR
jgi:heme-degrading monooxygenase HmoA